MGLPSWLRRRTRTPPFFLPHRRRRERSASVAEDAVIGFGHKYLAARSSKFLLIPLKTKKSPALTIR